MGRDDGLQVHVGKDGRTSYERRRGRACRAPVATFGEKVWYKQIREQKERMDTIESEWHEGLWLGQSRSTNETTEGSAEGVVRAYATRRQDVDERWKGDLVKKGQGTPATPDPNREQLMIPIRVRFGPPQVGEPDPTMQPVKEPLEELVGNESDGDEAGRELCRKNTERENQRIAEKMERDLGKTGDELMTQEPEEAEAPAASSGGDQEEMQEETAVMRTKRPMEGGKQKRRGLE